MKRTVVGLILVGLLLSIGGTSATAGLVDDLAKKATDTVPGGKPEERVDPPKRDMTWLNEYIRTRPPGSCYTGIKVAQGNQGDYSGNHDRSATRSCFLSYRGPNLYVEGYSQGWKGIYKEGVSCSGSPLCGLEPSPSQIHVALLHNGKPLVQCLHSSYPEPTMAHCENWGSEASILWGTVLECRAWVFAPMAFKAEFTGACQSID